MTLIMKKALFILIALLSFNINAQTYYGYVSRDNSSSDNDNSCETLLRKIERDGRYLDVSFGNYRSTSIDKIRWYDFNDFLVCVVYFEFSNNYGYSSSKGYVYGGWDYDFDKYYDLRKAFENAESSGKFFWKYIEPAKVSCD